MRCSHLQSVEKYDSHRNGDLASLAGIHGKSSQETHHGGYLLRCLDERGYICSTWRRSPVAANSLEHTSTKTPPRSPKP